MINGLIFDVDGVVADSEAVNARASIRVFEDLFGVTGVRREDFEAGLGRGAAAYVRAAAEVHGIHLSDEEVEAATRVRQKNFLKILHEESLPAFPGVLELMTAALADENWRLAIATSSSREKSGAVLASAGVPVNRMEYVCGDDVTYKKPNPELFQIAVDRLRLKPSQCVVIEDAPNGVEAAHAAGCKCVAVTNSTTGEKLAAADRVVASLEDITLRELAGMLV